MLTPEIVLLLYIHNIYLYQVITLYTLNLQVLLVHYISVKLKEKERNQPKTLIHLWNFTVAFIGMRLKCKMSFLNMSLWLSSPERLHLLGYLSEQYKSRFTSDDFIDTACLYSHSSHYYS